MGRSALALKTLLYEEGGAIAAAATTSLPSRWRLQELRLPLRLGAGYLVHLDAFINLELREEVHAAVSWLLQAVRNDLHLTSTSSTPCGGRIAEPAGDHRHSRLPAQPAGAVETALPGKASSRTYGDLSTPSRGMYPLVISSTTTPDGMLADLADRCCDVWRHKDAGLWELSEHRALHDVEDRLLGRTGQGC